jgi:hypothetical protein
MSTHPLARFTYETFGEQFGNLVLAGYGAESGDVQRSLRLTESGGGEETDWAIELVALRHPCGEEPLVLAALLKLLVSRPVVTNCLEFKMGELLAELRWRDDPVTRLRANEVIVLYTSLLYIKRSRSRAGRRSTADALSGGYHLVTGYVREARAEAGSVFFDDGFIRGLKLERVFFAGVDCCLTKQIPSPAEE